MKDVIDFYEDNGYPLKKLFQAAERRGINQPNLYAGMQQIYDKVMAGEPIKKINYARLAFAAAEHLDASAFSEVAKKVIMRSDEWFRMVDKRIADLEKTSLGYRWKKFWEGNWTEVW